MKIFIIIKFIAIDLLIVTDCKWIKLNVIKFDENIYKNQIDSYWFVNSNWLLSSCKQLDWILTNWRFDNVVEQVTAQGKCDWRSPSTASSSPTPSSSNTESRSDPSTASARWPQPTGPKRWWRSSSIGSMISAVSSICTEVA